MTAIVGAADALRHPGPSHPRSCTTVRRGRSPWSSGNPCTAAGRLRAQHGRWWLLSHEAMTWAMYDAPRLMNGAGKPDVTARDVLFVYAEKARPDGTNSFPSPELISDVTGLDVTTIRKAVRRLEDAKLIVRDGKRSCGAVKWRLNLELRRPVSHKEERAAQEAARRAATAERTRRYRAAAKAREKAESEADAGDSAAPVTGSAGAADVTGAAHRHGDRPEVDVTGSGLSRDGRCARDVTGAAPYEPVKEPPGGIGGRAAAPQTPAASTPGSGSVGGFSPARLDLETHVPRAHGYPREAPAATCAHGKSIEPFTDGTSQCSRCRIGLNGGLRVVRGA